MSEILTGGPLKFTEPNCPTRVGEYINTLGDIYSIPNPRLGMQVFVKDEKRTYIVTELKSKTINGVVVPNAQVGGFDLLGEKSIAWGASSNMNSFTTAGVYNIKGERTNANDNLPISNSNPGHTVSGRLIVLDSSIDGTGDSQDKCITQLLTLSNRTGEDGNTYIRTASGASLDSLTWKSWATQQTNVNVGQVASLDSFIDNGIYSGVFVESGVPSTFVMIVINDYFVGVSPRRVSQFLYKLSKTGEVSYTTRIGVGDGTITWNGWETINKKELDATATELLARIQGTSENSSASNDPFKRYPTNFSSVTDTGFMEALNAMHSTDSTSGVEGFWRLYIGKLAVEVKNVAIKYVDDTWVQTIKLPYKWYKSSSNFGIDDENYRVHTYYRIHKDGAWGDWKEVEEELKSAITAEENRAKAEEAAIRKLITDLIGESPETLDSIHEISFWILNDKTGAAAMAKAISENKTAIETEQERAMNAEDGLAEAIGMETSVRLSSDNDIKMKAALFGMAAVRPNTNSIKIEYKNVEQNATGAVEIPAATPEKAGVMSAEDKVALDTATSRALRALFVAAGAEYNDTNSVIEKTAPWGTEETWIKNDDGTYTYTETPAIVQHLPKHYYLNGLGDITEEQMAHIYNAGKITSKEPMALYSKVNIRTTLKSGLNGEEASGISYYYLCNGNRNLETFCATTSKLTVVKNMHAAFTRCNKLTHIFPVLNINEVVNASELSKFVECYSLIYCKLMNLKVTCSFLDSPNICKESILYIISKALPSVAITITLHPDAYARLADDADIVAALEAQPLISLVSA